MVSDDQAANFGDLRGIQLCLIDSDQVSKNREKLTSKESLISLFILIKVLQDAKDHIDHLSVLTVLLRLLIPLLELNVRDTVAHTLKKFRDNGLDIPYLSYLDLLNLYLFQVERQYLQYKLVVRAQHQVW